MRQRDIKIGMAIQHTPTRRYLGNVTEILANVVKYKPYPPTDNIPYGIAGFTEIDPYYGAMPE